MKAGALLVLVAAVAVLAGMTWDAQGRPELVKCGKARWNVKALADPEASDVTLRPIKAGVADLASLPAPAHVPNSLPRQTGFGRVEFHTYRVTADLSGWKRSPDDSDVHLVIAGPESGKTMIVEFPLADCIPATTPAKLRKRMVRAREKLMDACKSVSFTTKLKPLAGRATITGVAFFDKDHGQDGVADNAIELHPVLTYKSHGCGPG
jgi:hypothetical protein